MSFEVFLFAKLFITLNLTNYVHETFFSVARRAFIEAKYVQKSFLRPLPSASQARSSTRSIKRWTVRKSSTSNDNDDDPSKPANRHLLSKFVFYFLILLLI